MGLAALLRRWIPDERTVRSLAADAARRCETAVWQQVGERASTMPLAEARGYVRARSAAIVERQVELALLGSPHVAAWRTDVLEQALEATVVRAIDVLRTRGAAATPRRQAA